MNNNRLLEICERVIEINKTAKDYVAVFADGGWDNHNLKDRYFFIFKDGDGQNELMDINYDDYCLLKDNDLLENNSYSGFKARSVFEFKIENVESKIKELRGEANE